MTQPVTATREALLGVYRPSGPEFVGGEGVYLVADDGRRYLDMTSGIGVNALGYGDPDVADAIRGALDAGLLHTSNLFRTRPAGELAEWLVERSFADRVFFCNSGAEANEGALKFARRYAGAQEEGRVEILAFRGAFHGRTMGALAATDRPAYQDPFRPLVPGVRFCPLGDEEKVAAVLREGRIAAVIVEPIQGEGGVLPVSPAFLRTLRALCDETGTLLIFDEVQVGLGRTGALWAHELSEVTPDLLTVAKPLGGGLPMGAVLLTERVAAEIRPGDHATTFGGGPLVASAALAACRKIGEPGFLAGVRAKGRLVEQRLERMRARSSAIVEARGRGLIWGVKVQGSAAEVVDRAREDGVLLCTAGPDVVRLLPPLVASEAELTRGLDALEAAL